MINISVYAVLQAILGLSNIAYSFYWLFYSSGNFNPYIFCVVTVLIE